MEKLRVLVGDDQIGQADSPARISFSMKYGELAKFEFTADPHDFVGKAKAGNFDALMIDLKWCAEDAEREDKTGYQVLLAVRDLAPVRVLFTSESDEAREKGYDYGATHCIGKSPRPDFLLSILKGGK